MTVRYGIIGGGMMAQEHIRNISLLDGACVTALADPDPGMRRKSQELAGGRATAYSDARDMTAEQECDAFVIATPNDTHFELLSHILTLRRPVLAEKPLCTNLDDCRRIAETAQECDVPVWVAMEYRFMPPLAELIQRVASGEAGPPVMMAIREHRYPFLNKVGYWNRFNCRTGGTMVEKCCHFWDLMRLVLDSDPVRVFASGSIAVNHLDEEYEGRNPDIVDNAFVILDFENGARGMLDLCMFAEGAYWQETVSVTGPRARIDAMVPGPARFLPDGEERVPAVEVSSRAGRRPIRREVPVNPEILRAGDHYGATFYQHERFLALAKGEIAAPLVTIDDGSWAVAVGEAAERSARTGKAVEITRL